MDNPASNLFNMLNSVHIRTELLESAGWDEEAVEVLIEKAVEELEYLFEKKGDDEIDDFVLYSLFKQRMNKHATPEQADIVIKLFAQQFNMEIKQFENAGEA